ncbi:MAG: hypothetical protein IBJ18_11630 [Phycisphaerales bacterium]|nr:hypothetical protein [Phycisphaerales bacterium]
MARTLIGKHGTLRMTNLQYGLAMKLVYDLGWKPAGTLPPLAYEGEDPPLDEEGNPKRWPKMNYFAGAGQRVSDADAKRLGEKLEDMLLDIPNHDATMHKVMQVIVLPPLGEMRVLKPGEKVNMVEFFSGRNKNILRKYAEFCKQGGFSINS